MNLNETGLFLKNERTKENISQEELSFLTGLSHGHLSRIESGNLNFTMLSFIKICSAFFHIVSTPFAARYVGVEIIALPANQREFKKLRCLSSFQAYPKVSSGFSTCLDIDLSAKLDR